MAGKFFCLFKKWGLTFMLKCNIIRLWLMKGREKGDRKQ